MSQRREYTEFDNGQQGNSSAGKSIFFNIFVPVLVFAVLILCIVTLALVVRLGKKVDGIETGIQAMQAAGNETVETSAAAESISAAGEAELMQVSDIDGNSVDASEAADIIEAAEYENKHVWDGRGDYSDGIKRVYLTFDDGPSANTDKILDILDEYGVKATFFVVGKGKGYADQYRRIVESGHTLGMHSYSHKYSEVYASKDAYIEDLTMLHDFLYEVTGKDCSFVRFPGGSSNTISEVDMHELAAYIEEQGMTYFDWNVAGGDAAGGYKSAEEIADNVLENIGRYNNSVVLLHDASGKDSTVEALPIIIESILESEDTVILPISESTVKVQHLH